MLNGELYALRFQKLIYLHLFTELFHEDLSSEVLFRRLKRDLHETVL